MKSMNERRLLRLLMRQREGDLSTDAVRQLEQVLARDSGLRSTYESFVEIWDGLELPEPRDAPDGFADVIVGAARSIRDSELNWSLAPTWVRLGAAAALTTGLLVGVIFDRPIADGQALHAAADAVPLSLAEVYWLALEDGDDLFGEDATGSETRVR